MKHTKHIFSLLGLIASLMFMVTVSDVFSQQQRQGFSREDVEKAKAEDRDNSQRKGAPAESMENQLGCAGKINQVLDVAYEGVKFTSANYFASPGGGEGGGFAKTPVLTTRVRLEKEVCLDAHLSAIVGSRATYGVAALTLFQVTLTPVGGGPRHMVGHYERPYGSANGPAVALEAERDVDMYASNFFQRVGDGKHEVPPGDYRVDVWWSGNGPGGAIGAAFVLKLYLR